MGLLDDFSGFIKTPEGVGLLSAAFGGMAGARRGTPWNNMGRAGMSGVMGYSNAIDDQQTQALRKIQIDDAARKQKIEDAISAAWVGSSTPQQGYSPAVAQAFGVPQQSAKTNDIVRLSSLYRQAAQNAQDPRAAMALTQKALEAEIEEKKVAPKWATEPKIVRDKSGNLVALQMNDAGDSRPMSYLPAEKVDWKNAGNALVPKGEYGGDMPGLKPLPVSMSPDAAASNRVARERLDFDKGQAGKPVYSADAHAWLTPPSQTNPKGTVTPVPMAPGGKAPEAFSKAAKQLNDLEGALGEYEKAISENKGSVWGVGAAPKHIPLPFADKGLPLPQGSTTTKLSSNYTSLMMGLKNLYELGALAGPDMQVLEGNLQDPATFKGYLTSLGSYEEQMKVVKGMLKRAKMNLSSAYGGRAVPDAAQGDTNSDVLSAADEIVGGR